MIDLLPPRVVLYISDEGIRRWGPYGPLIEEDMNEFSDLTPDEIRVLREHRAKKAMEARPQSEMEQLLIDLISNLCMLGKMLNPTRDRMWSEIEAHLP